MQQQKDSTTNEEEDQVTRVDGIPSDRPLGSTASRIEVIPAFTTGPWTYFGGTHSIYGNWEGKEVSVCIVTGPQKFGIDSPRARQREANARLIASAPELVDALRDLIDAIPDNTLKADPPLRGWVNRAAAVLTKAIGGVA